MTRRSPARFLGLADLGHLNPGAIADVVAYRCPAEPMQADWEQVFARPTHVFRRGRLVVRDGVMIDVAEKRHHAVVPSWDAAWDAEVKSRVAAAGQLPFSVLQIGDEELARDLGVPFDLHASQGGHGDAD